MAEIVVPGASAPVERTEFGFKRCVATGHDEVLNCRFMPGFLIPADLERMASFCGWNDTVKWAMEHLLASRGATVVYKGQLRHVGSLVPKRQANGHCFYLYGDLCAIHEVSPFGCAFFHTQMTDQEADAVSEAGIMAMMKDREEHGLYSQIWDALNAMRRIAKPASDCKREMRAGWQGLNRE